MQRVASVFPPRWNRRARALGARRRRNHRARSRDGVVVESPLVALVGRDTHVVAQKLRDGPIMVLAKRVDEAGKSDWTHRCGGCSLSGSMPSARA